jgi:hypothetical protein
MGLPETTQAYIVAPADPIYHLPLSETLTLCGLWLHGELGQRRRKDDRRLVSEKPKGRFNALCSQCERKATGSPELRRPSLELLPRFSPIGLYPEKIASDPAR